MRFSSRRQLSAVLVAALANATFLGGQARADEAAGEADACFTAAERAQPLIRQKRLREARAELEVCARDICPQVARTDCRNWLADVGRDQPSIVVVAQEVNAHQDPREVTGVRMLIDGAIMVDKIDAEPIAIDPGTHHLRAEKPGYGPLEQNVEIHEGEKARVVNFFWYTSHAPPQSLPTVESSRPAPASFYVLGALGLVGLGVGTYLEIAGLNKRTTELQPCEPNCSSASVDEVRNIVRAGDITLGAAGLLMVGAGIAYWTRPASSLPPPPGRMGLLLGPTTGGWMAGIRGSL